MRLACSCALMARVGPGCKSAVLGGNGVTPAPGCLWMTRAPDALWGGFRPCCSAHFPTNGRDADRLGIGAPAIPDRGPLCRRGARVASGDESSG